MSPETQIIPTENKEKISTYLWCLFLVCFVGNVMGGTASTIMSVYLPVLAKELASSHELSIDYLSSLLVGSYILSWTIGGLTGGYISDRIGRAKTLAIAIATFGLFTALISISPSLIWALVFRMFCGLGVGATLVVTTTIMADVWPKNTKAIFIGVVSVGFPVGIFSSGAIGYFFPEWREGFLFGLLPLVLGISSFWIVRESAQWKESRSASTNNTKPSISAYRADLFHGIVIFGSMLIGLWALFSWVPTWMQSLLSESSGQNERSIGMMLLGAGGVTGGILSGWISKMISVRKAMMMCFAGCFVASVLLFKFNQTFTPLIYVELAFLALFFGISQGLLAVYIPMLFPVTVRGTATGICFNTGRVLTALIIPFIGILVIQLGGFGNSLFVFSLIFLVGLVVTYFSRSETTDSRV